MRLIVLGAGLPDGHPRPLLKMRARRASTAVTLCCGRRRYRSVRYALAAHSPASSFFSSGAARRRNRPLYYFSIMLDALDVPVLHSSSCTVSITHSIILESWIHPPSRWHPHVGSPRALSPTPVQAFNRIEDRSPGSPRTFFSSDAPPLRHRSTVHSHFAR